MRSPIVAGFSEASFRVERSRDLPHEFRLFGRIALSRAGTDLGLRLSRQTQRLLAYLLVHRERDLSREHVAFTLWPDDDETDARSKLRRQLHLLQRALPDAGEPWILTTATTVGWNAAASYRLDIAEFERLSIGADAATADTLYTDDLLSELYDDWIVHERDRLRAVEIDNLFALVATHRQRRNFIDAIRYANRLRAIDPWREDAVRTLIALRYAAGDRAGALAEFERFRAALKAEFDVDPMPETICAYEHVVASDRLPDAADATVVALASADPAQLGLPFVNRRRELAELRSDWDRASRGAGTTVLVVGEAGIGKSRLIDRFALDIEANGGRVLRGGTSPFELTPYQAVAEALGSGVPMLRETKLEPMWLSTLATLVPQLGVDLPDLPPVTALDAGPERTRLFEAIARGIAALAAPRPLLLVLEDVHWAGPATIALLEYIARRAATHPLLLVVSYREDDLARTSPLRGLRRRLERERLVRASALGALAQGDIEAIVREFADAEPAERAEIAAGLLAASDGNPFVIGELVINDRETGALDARLRRWSRRIADVADVPSITATLTERLARLSARSRSFAEIAAVIGRSFSVELVREVSGIDERSALDQLEELVDRRLVREFAATTGDFAFSHQLIQQTVYATMPAEARTRRHRRVGIVIEEMYGEQIEAFAAELATHYDRGGEPERAAEYYRLAARQALGLYANDEAKALAVRGLGLTVGGETQLELLLILEEAHRRLGERREQRSAIASMLELARAQPNIAMLRESLRRRIMLLHACGEREAERSTIAELEAQLIAAPAPWPAIAGQLKGSYLTAVGNFRTARACIATALSTVSILDHPRIAIECRCALVELAGFDGDVAEVRRFLAELPLLESPNLDRSLSVTLLETACAAASKIQDYPTLAACAERLMACANSIGYLEGEAAAEKFAGRAAAKLFAIDRARSSLERAGTMFAALGQKLKQFHVLVDIANLNTSIGRFDDAIGVLHAAEAIATSISYEFGQAASANNISYAAYLSGDYALAKEAALRALAVGRAIDAPSACAHALVSLGVAERELGDLSDSITHLEDGVDLERRLGEHAALGEDLSELASALLRAGRFDRAAAVCRELLALVDEDERQLTHPHSMLWAAASYAHATGDASRARELLERARVHLDRLEAAIPDAASRSTFRSLPYHRAIDTAFDHGRWIL